MVACEFLTSSHANPFQILAKVVSEVPVRAENCDRLPRIHQLARCVAVLIGCSPVLAARSGACRRLRQVTDAIAHTFCTLLPRTHLGSLSSICLSVCTVSMLPGIIPSGSLLRPTLLVNRAPSEVLTTANGDTVFVYDLLRSSTPERLPKASPFPTQSSSIFQPLPTDARMYACTLIKPHSLNEAYVDNNTSFFLFIYFFNFLFQILCLDRMKIRLRWPAPKETRRS